MMLFVDYSQVASFDMSYKEVGVKEITFEILVKVRKFYLDIILC
jgi:hypothetical protein